MKSKFALAAGTAVGMALLLWPAAAQEKKKSVNEGVYTVEQASRGATVYQDQCETCHGDPRTGGDDAPNLAGEDFVDHWNGKTIMDLAQRLQTTMPASDPGSLTRQEYVDVIAFILNQNAFPSGKEELTSDAVLRSIVVEARKKK
jgi:mono/diheme cytochrome c family protein